MGQTETSNASDVSGLAPGTLVEVKGTLRCEEPLTSEMAGERCAYYSSKVVREYLERDYDDDDDVGSDRRSEVVAHNEQFAPFTVEDPTGSGGPSISLGGATINLVGVSAPSATATPRASWRWTRWSTYSGRCRRTVGSGVRRESRGSGSTSATAPRRYWDRALVRPSCSWAWEPSPRSSWGSSCSPSRSSSWWVEGFGH